MKVTIRNSYNWLHSGYRAESAGVVAGLFIGGVVGAEDHRSHLHASTDSEPAVPKRVNAIGLGNYT